jgi:hypothetical protein
LSSVKPLEKNAPAFSLNHQPRKNARKNLNAGACSVFCVDGSGQLAEIVTAWRYLSSLFFRLSPSTCRKFPPRQSAVVLGDGGTLGEVLGDVIATWHWRPRSLRAWQGGSADKQKGIPKDALLYILHRFREL